MTEVVNPLEVYMRSSSYDLWHAPFIIRNRVVDRLALQSTAPNLSLAPAGDEGGGEAYSTGGDPGRISLPAVADVPRGAPRCAAGIRPAPPSRQDPMFAGRVRPAPSVLCE